MLTPNPMLQSSARSVSRTRCDDSVHCSSPLDNDCSETTGLESGRLAVGLGEREAAGASPARAALIVGFRRMSVVQRLPEMRSQARMSFSWRMSDFDSAGSSRMTAGFGDGLGRSSHAARSSLSMTPRS